MNRLLDGEVSLSSQNRSRVSHLSAHRRVEGGPLRENRSSLPVRQGLHDLILPILRGEAHKRGDFRSLREAVIACKLCPELRVKPLIDVVSPHIIRGFPGGPCGLPLQPHRLLEALLVDALPLVRENLPRKIRRKAEGIVEAEGVLTGQNLLPPLLHLFLKL